MIEVIQNSYDMNTFNNYCTSYPPLKTKICKYPKLGNL